MLIIYILQDGSAAVASVIRIDRNALCKCYDAWPNAGKEHFSHRQKMEQQSEASENRYHCYYC